MKSSKMYTAAIATLTVANFPATAISQEGGGFSILMTVPIECDIEADTFVLDAENDLVVGTVHEFCNSGAGFQVIASHRPLDDGEHVDIDYDGNAAVLDASGLSSIASRFGARSGSVPVAIRTKSVDDVLAVGLAITVI